MSEIKSKCCICNKQKPSDYKFEPANILHEACDKHRPVIIERWRCAIQEIDELLATK